MKHLNRHVDFLFQLGDRIRNTNNFGAQLQSNDKSSVAQCDFNHEEHTVMTSIYLYATLTHQFTFRMHLTCDLNALSWNSLPLSLHLSIQTKLLAFFCRLMDENRWIMKCQSSEFFSCVNTFKTPSLDSGNTYNTYNCVSIVNCMDVGRQTMHQTNSKLVFDE